MISRWATLPFWLAVTSLCAIAALGRFPQIALPLGLFFIAILPGYFLLQLLWPPGRDSSAPRWRWTLLLPASIALVGLLLLILNYAGLYTVPVALASVLVLNLCLLLLANLQRPALSLLPSRAWLAALAHWRGSRPGPSHLLLIASAILFCLAAGYAIGTPPNAAPLTEFYVVTAAGRLPLQLSAAQIRRSGLKAGIVNHEGQAVAYRVQVSATAAGRLVQLWEEDVSLADAAAVELPIDLASLPSAAKGIHLYLLRGAPASPAPDPYRSLFIQLE